MNETITQLIEQADTAALATTGPHGLNVVPISVFAYADGEVRICHFFMNKTIENLRAQPEAAFTCWSGFAGVQVKGKVTIEESGELFDQYVESMNKRFPERTLLAVLRITPEHIYDVAPQQNGRELS